MIHLKPLHLFSFIILAAFFYTDLLALRCTRKCGNVIIISTFGMNFLESSHFHIFLVVLGIFVVGPLLATTWIAYTEKEEKKKKLRDDQFEQNGGNLLRRKLNRENPQLILYTDQEIKSITNNYSAMSDGLLRCCTRAFYRGSLSGGGEVAVVMIERVSLSNINRFVDQLIYLSQSQNTNLVRLIGVCMEKHYPLLVYELHGDGGTTLSDCTRDRSRASRFTCERRVKAAAGVARGFASFTTFMHGATCRANIVMDDGSFDAKIFYAAGSVHEDNDTYTAPEFFKSGRFNNKSDVYSFGVVLVEVLTGCGDDPKMVPDFVNFSKAGRLHDILDAEMKDDGYVEVVGEVAKLAERCLNVKPRRRPTMKKVEAKLIKLVNDAMMVPREL